MGKSTHDTLDLQKGLSSKDVEQLIKPIHKDFPTGEFLLYSDTYDKIRNARFNEDKDIPRGVWVRPLKEAEWNVVEQLCIQALTKQTKDLQIAAWLLEAWFHKHQIWGLYHGLVLERKLMTLFWSDVHPYANDDPEYRLAPIEWLNQKFVTNLIEVPLTFPQTNGQAPFTYGDYRKISTLNNTLKMNEARSPERDKNTTQIKTLAEDFKAAQLQTSQEYYKSLLLQLDACLEEMTQIEEFIHLKYKQYPGCLNNLRSHVQNIRHITFLLNQDKEKMTPKKSLDAPIRQPEIKSDPVPLAPQPAKAPPKLKEPLTYNRQQAYAQLQVIADHLAEIEPHSPTPYMIRKAVSWGNMSFADVMSELSQEGGDILKILKLLGIHFTPKNQ